MGRVAELGSLGASPLTVTTSDAQEVLDSLDAATAAGIENSRWNPAEAAIVVPKLLDCLEVADTTVRHRAMSALVRIGPEAHSAIDLVIRLMFDSDPLIADVAIHTLGRISLRCPDRAITPLVHAASKPTTQKSALFALIGFGHDAISATATFTAAFESRDARIRRLALRGLKEIGADASITEPIVSRGLHDTNGLVRAAAQKLSVCSRQ